jgi:hypothetical protein
VPGTGLRVTVPGRDPSTGNKREVLRLGVGNGELGFAIKTEAPSSPMVVLRFEKVEIQGRSSTKLSLHYGATGLLARVSI